VTVYVVMLPSDHIRLLAVCSSMDEVVRRFGTSWQERVNVHEVEVDGEIK
jgi:hypothetical protein